METITIETTLKDLVIAKHNVSYLLEDGHGEASIDMHGLEYCAGRVERLRELIKNSLIFTSVA